jgi:hypothetical protein
MISAISINMKTGAVTWGALTLTQSATTRTGPRAFTATWQDAAAEFSAFPAAVDVDAEALVLDGITFRLLDWRREGDVATARTDDMPGDGWVADYCERMGRVMSA